MSADKITCASCNHMGRVYHSSGGDLYDHMCAKSDIRRQEGMSKSADFFDHFRTFFDANAHQKVCRHYEERPLANERTLAMLVSMAENNGRGEFGFWSEENSLATKLDKLFIKSDWYADTKDGKRAYLLLPMGKAEIARASTATPTGDPQ